MVRQRQGESRESFLERQREYRQRDIEKWRAYGRSQYQRMKEQDPEKLREQKRQQHLRYKEKHPETYRQRVAASSRAYRQAHPDRRSAPEVLREYGRRARLRLREQALTAYGGKCSCCGESTNEFLCIDHTDGNGAEHRRAMGVKTGSGPIYRWLKTHDYPSGFRVLCHNCNLAFGFYGYCPHQRNPE